MKDRELCVNFPTTGIRALVIGTRIFLVCFVVTALIDLPHHKRIFLEPYFFCQFSETIRRFQIREGAMAGSHVEEGGEQARGKDSGPSTRGRKCHTPSPIRPDWRV